MRVSFAWMCAVLLPMAVVAEEGEATNGETQRPRFSSGYEAYQAGDWEEALRRFTELESKRPNDYEVKLNLGSTLYRSQSYQEAIHRYNEAAVSGDPELQAEALYNLGNVAYRSGGKEFAFDQKTLTITGNPSAAGLIKPAFRVGWQV